MLLSLLVLLRGGLHGTGARIPEKSLHAGMNKTQSCTNGKTLHRWCVLVWRLRLRLETEAPASTSPQAQLPLAQPARPGMLLSFLLAQLPLAQLTPPGMALNFPQAQLPLACMTRPGMLFSFLLAQLLSAQPTVRLRQPD